MPKCPTKLLFNIDCPGCGFQRAIHAIIHGEFKRAFSLNPFLFLAAPYAIIAFSYEPNILDVEAYYKNGEKTSHATTLPVFPFDLRSVSVRSPFRLRSISVPAPLWKRGEAERNRYGSEGTHMFTSLPAYCSRCQHAGRQGSLGD